MGAAGRSNLINPIHAIAASSLPIQLVRILSSSNSELLHVRQGECILTHLWHGKRCAVRAKLGLLRDMNPVRPALCERGFLAEAERAPFLSGLFVGADSHVPPSSFACRIVLGQFHGEFTLPVVFFLRSFPHPGVAGKLGRFKPPALEWIGSVALLIKAKRDRRAVFVLPFAR